MQECFLGRYSELLWQDRLKPKCSILPLLFKDTRATDKSLIFRLVLHYCPARGKKSLEATTKSMRPGLTHLAIRCSLPFLRKGKRRTPLGNAVLQHVSQVLSNVPDTCTLRELVLDLRGLEQFVREGFTTLCTYLQGNDGYPQLSNLVVRGGTEGGRRCYVDAWKSAQDQKFPHRDLLGHGHLLFRIEKCHSGGG